MANETKKVTQQEQDFLNSYAEKLNYDNFNDMRDSLKTNLKSENKQIYSDARNTVNQFGKDLYKFVMYQSMEASWKDNEEIAWAQELFWDGKIEQGDGKVWTKKLLTGKGTLDLNKFVPDKLSTKFIKEKSAQIYGKDSTGEKVYTSEAYEFFKWHTETSINYVPYFVNGTLQTFTSDLVEEVQDVYRIFVYDRTLIEITSMAPSTSITGTAPNGFDALTKEILPLIRRFKMLNTEFCYDKAGFPWLHSVKRADVKVMVSPNVLTYWSAYIQSQLYKPELVALETLINEGNVLTADKKIIIGDQDTLITVSTDPYIDDNTIYVFEKDLIKHNAIYDETANQFFGHNQTNYNNALVVGMIYKLPWMKAFKYTNEHLMTNPA